MGESIKKTYDISNFINGLDSLNLHISDEQMNQFLSYYELLVEWNEFMNLTAITEFEEVVLKHFLDSLTLVKACELNNQSLIDIGTGAGFPGIPLKIVFPEIRITLLDSLNKRIHFLEEVIGRLGLKKIEAIHGRAEDYARNSAYREQYDICVSRAVSNMTTLSEYCIPFVKAGGIFVSYKSEKLTEELNEAKKAIQILGGVLKDQVEMTLPDSTIYRNLLVILKEKETPRKFPRKAGIPSKDPIR